jgi:hypothetical protein
MAQAQYDIDATAQVSQVLRHMLLRAKQQVEDEQRAVAALQTVLAGAASGAGVCVEGNGGLT